jgi:hypothetical protein
MIFVRFEIPLFLKVTEKLQTTIINTNRQVFSNPGIQILN